MIAVWTFFLFSFSQFTPSFSLYCNLYKGSVLRLIHGYHLASLERTECMQTKMCLRLKYKPLFLSFFCFFLSHLTIKPICLLHGKEGYISVGTSVLWSALSWLLVTYIILVANAGNLKHITSFTPQDVSQESSTHHQELTNASVKAFITHNLMGGNCCVIYQLAIESCKTLLQLLMWIRH